MTDATLTTIASPALSVPSPSYLEETIKAEVAKALAEAKAEESKLVTTVKTFIAAHYSKVVTAVLGWFTAHFGLVELLWKLL